MSFPTRVMCTQHAQSPQFMCFGPSIPSPWPYVSSQCSLDSLLSCVPPSVCTHNYLSRLHLSFLFFIILIVIREKKWVQIGGCLQWIGGPHPNPMKVWTDGLMGQEAVSLSHCVVSWGRISLNLNRPVNSVTQHLTLQPVN